MINPFNIPDSNGSSSRPLRPWQSKDHNELYAPVDHTEVSFRQFEEFLNNIDDIATFGGVVLVTGLPGCGKTSLVHRCVDLFSRKFSESLESGERSEILDVAHSGLAGSDTDARIGAVLTAILDKLELRGVLALSEIEFVNKRKDTVATAFSALSDILQNNRLSLFIVLPKSELAVEISRYCQYSHSRIVFFCETSSEDTRLYFRDSVTATEGLRITLEVGTLTVDDGWTFVSSRLSRLTNESSHQIAISEATMTQFMETRLGGSQGRTNILELHKTCFAVYEQAIKRNVNEIGYIDFLEYYTSEGYLR